MAAFSEPYELHSDARLFFRRQASRAGALITLLAHVKVSGTEQRRLLLSGGLVTLDLYVWATSKVDHEAIPLELMARMSQPHASAACLSRMRTFCLQTQSVCAASSVPAAAKKATALYSRCI